MSDGPRSRPAAAPWAGAAAVVGGALICTGTALPWLYFFAGLQSYSGLVGLYGRILFAGGVLAVVGGAAMLVRRDRWLRPALGAAGVLQTLFVIWLLLGLRSTALALLRMHAMLLARPGPGLFVALAGAVLVAATVWPPGRGSRRRRGRPARAARS